MVLTSLFEFCCMKIIKDEAMDDDVKAEDEVVKEEVKAEQE